MTKSYSELIKLKTYEERLKYLKLKGAVASETFGYDRYLNQMFYKSPEWLSTRDDVIVRDQACDLGIKDREIYSNITVHHINPITPDDIKNRSAKLTDPENLICTSDKTHKAVHYGNESMVLAIQIERKQNDTIPWRE
jgi:hypothetical protein